MSEVESTEISKSGGGKLCASRVEVSVAVRTRIRSAVRAVRMSSSGLETSIQSTSEVGLERGGFTEHVSAFENRRGYVQE